VQLAPHDLAHLRARIGTDELDAALVAAQLLEMVEKLQKQLGAAEDAALEARGEIARQAAALEARLESLRESGGECLHCRNAEARAALARLKELAGA
jgi:molybdopterin converting factor small subunit